MSSLAPARFNLVSSPTSSGETFIFLTCARLVDHIPDSSRAVKSIFGFALQPARASPRTEMSMSDFRMLPVYAFQYVGSWLVLWPILDGWTGEEKAAQTWYMR